MPIYAGKENDLRAWRHSATDFTTKSAWNATKKKFQKSAWVEVVWDRANAQRWP